VLFFTLSLERKLGVACEVFSQNCECAFQAPVEKSQSDGGDTDMLQQLDTAIAFVVVMLMLSLLVTAIVQAISALLDLRGKNLARALTDLFKQIDSAFRKPPENTSSSAKFRNWFVHPFSKLTLASKLADAVTKHPTVAHGFSRAKAIRKEELLEILKDLCSADPARKIDTAVKDKLNQLLSRQIPGDAQTVGTAQLIADQLALQIPTLKDDAKTTVAAVAAVVVGNIRQLEAGIQKWFDTVMDRASDVFTRWTRIITVALSLLFVVTLHIDAGLILHQISTDPQIKAGLTKMSDSALAQADETLKNGNRASSALIQVAEKHKGDPVEADLNNATDLVTCAAGESWLKTYSIANNSKVEKDKLVKEFQEACQQRTVAALDKSKDEITKLRHDLATTQLVLIPDGVTGPTVFDSKDRTICQKLDTWFAAYTHNPRHVLGTLAMVILLSLGAPFWFNALRQLSNLKPAISGKIAKEQTQGQHG
jgi:hypothetical protein